MLLSDGACLPLVCASSLCPALTVRSSCSGHARAQSSDVLSPALGPVVKPPSGPWCLQVQGGLLARAPFHSWEAWTTACSTVSALGS